MCKWLAPNTRPCGGAYGKRPYWNAPFQGVQLSLSGPDKMALPTSSRHTVPTHDQSTITRLSHVVKNPVNMRVKRHNMDAIF